jgi:hypothetical protein
MRISSDAAARDMRHYDSFSSSQLGSSISMHINRWSKQGTLRGDLEGVFCQPFLALDEKVEKCAFYAAF